MDSFCSSLCNANVMNSFPNQINFIHVCSTNRMEILDISSDKKYFLLNAAKLLATQHNFAVETKCDVLSL